ncbi:hypothetical protein LB521_22915 [Mesorhizobium sp. BR-1-1-8]|uniref:hypothetical protein n=1 Tax=unclassified Mesorhizobium TaxID=325217 RepID=UPI001CCA4368|nr:MULTISPECIES: hypothetical protein [unclassified Mesorhizobium]MBZ9983990.1 hypothetical protein [Mesorhizobium sp. BR-1-1-8]
MVKLDWSDGRMGSACEHGELCAWIEQLPHDRRFSWSVDTPGDPDPENILKLDGGVEDTLAAAKLAVAEAMEIWLPASRQA